MPTAKNDSKPASEAQEAKEEPVDNVAMVSRHADGSDAQPHKTVRIIDDDAAAEADRAQGA